MSNQEELRRALEYPWDKWTVFLHPARRQVVERSYRGPARVSGSAGTGKTIVALHRAVHLARTYSDARVLLTTFSTAVADALRARVVRLIANEPKIAERLEVRAMADIGRRLYQAHFGRPDLAPRPGARAVAPGRRRGRRPPVQLALPVDRVEPRGRRLAACELGTVSGRAPAVTQIPPRSSPTPTRPGALRGACRPARPDATSRRR